MRRDEAAAHGLHRDKTFCGEMWATVDNCECALCLGTNKEAIGSFFIVVATFRVGGALDSGGRRVGGLDSFCERGLAGTTGLLIDCEGE